MKHFLMFFDTPTIKYEVKYINIKIDWSADFISFYAFVCKSELQLL